MFVSSFTYAYCTYKFLVGEPEGKRPLGRPRHRREDGMRMDLRETGWEAAEWD
jgi:hypothetical protein